MDTVPARIKISSRLPQVGKTIFSVMTELAQAHGAINLAQGFPGFAPDPLLADLAHQAMNHGMHQYAPMAGYEPLRQAVANTMAACYGAKYNVDSEITITSGATEAIFCAISAVVQPGDEVLVFEPCYDSYVPAILLNGGTPVYVPLSFPDYSIDWSLVKRYITQRTRAIILNSPHNPSGRLLTATDIQQLIHITSGSNILIISDEVYEHIVFDGIQHLSLSRYPELAERSFIIGSFGKSLHITGWKVGYCAAPAAFTAEFRKVHQYVTFSTATPLQVAIAEYLAAKPMFNDELRQFYQRKRDLFDKAMSQSRFEPFDAEGTYFQLYSYARIPELADLPDTEVCELLTSRHKVAAIPISVFYHIPTQNQVIRFCFAKDDDSLTEAARRLCAL